MSHEISRLEQRMYQALNDILPPSKGNDLKALYTMARNRLMDEVLPKTIVAEPNMTDHSAAHVLAVMNAADKLLDPDAFTVETHC